MATVGFLMFLVGASLADSDNLVIPSIFIICGMALVMLGVRKYAKQD